MISAPDNPQPQNTSRIKLRCGGALQTTAFVILLLCVVARPFLMELPFRVSMLYGINLAADLTEADLSVDRGELSRVIFASLLILATVLWLLGGSLAGRAKIRHGWLGVGVLVFALGTLFLVSSASNARDAMTVWAEQAALLSAAFLAVQIFADKRRFAILVVVLAALAGAMAIKGVWQIGFEAPQRIADFELHRAERLADMGWAEGTSQAKLVESRMRDWAPFGFFNLANMFASLLIVISAGACALGAQKLIAAFHESIFQKVHKDAGRGRKGEIPLPVLAAILTAIMAVAAVAILILTRSRGAIGSAVLAAIGCCVALVFAKRLSRHWKKCVLVGCIMFVLAASAVVGHGLANDSLPTKTMTFRWYYWTASAEMIADHPLYGVGPGNFAQNYLQYRRPAAEEEIKTPHNLFVHAAAQYGIPLGALFVLILAYVLIGATRPRTGQADDDEPPVAKPWRGWLLGAILVAGVFVARWQLANLHDPALLIFEGLLPAIAFAVCLMVAWWWAMPALLRSSSLVRVILTAGLFGLVLHNMVSFSLWAPGVATLFWVTAGACLAQAGPAKPRMFKGGYFKGVRAIFIFLVAMILIFVLKPVLARQPYVGKMLAEIRKGNLFHAAIQAEGKHTKADAPDPIFVADAARLYRAAARDPLNAWKKHNLLQAAYWAANRAVYTDRQNSTWRKLAASIAVEHVESYSIPAPNISPTMTDALIHMAAAVDLNPADARLRLQYARMLLDGERVIECAEQLDAAERLESLLTPGSVEQFTPAERAQIADLRQQATASRNDAGSE